MSNQLYERCEMTEYIKREDVLKRAIPAPIAPVLKGDSVHYEPVIMAEDVKSIPAADVMEIPKTGIGDMSDGYHTFNSLYHQRAVLFAVLVKAHRDRAWKSWRHSDGELPFGKENYFIVGIDTPEGSYTYHYHGEYWDMFDCEELERGKEWDGHTDKDVMRLFSLPVNVARGNKRGRWIIWNEPGFEHVECSECKVQYYEEDLYIGGNDFPHFCPNCGANMFDFGEACKQAMMEHEEV